MPTEEELAGEDGGDIMGGIESPILPADGEEEGDAGGGDSTAEETGGGTDASQE